LILIGTGFLVFTLFAGSIILKHRSHMGFIVILKIWWYGTGTSGLRPNYFKVWVLFCLVLV
jgi:hypothetical protein